jgi:hypothetical protein
MPGGLTTGSLYKVCIYNGTTPASSTLQGSSTGTYNALPSVTLSPSVGPTAGTNTITATALTPFLTGITPGAFFSRVDCPALYVDDSDTIPASAVTKISNYKAAFTVPVGVALTLGEATAAYKLCIYGGTTGSDTLISAPGAYTIAPVLGVTSANPLGGPAQGLSTVVITGTGFPLPANTEAILSASIGGSPLTDITKLTATTFSGKTSAHAPGAASISVTTAAGTKSGGTYTFSYGITVAPNTAPNTGVGATVFLDVQGAGFEALTASFALSTNLPADSSSVNAHVYLVDGAYNNTAITTTKTVPQIEDCLNVMVISDVELICQLTLTAGVTNATPTAAGPAVPKGTYTVTVVDKGDIGATPLSASIISSGSTFTVADY